MNLALSDPEQEADNIALNGMSLYPAILPGTGFFDIIEFINFRGGRGSTLYSFLSCFRVQWE